MHVQHTTFKHVVLSDRYYGCGLVFPEAVGSCTVVDLGSGSGRDCYILSKLVGETGFVTGVDMTAEQVFAKCLLFVFIIGIHVERHYVIRCHIVTKGVGRGELLGLVMFGYAITKLIDKFKVMCIRRWDAKKMA